MKRNLLLTLIATFLIFSNAEAADFWTKTNGPNGGMIKSAVTTADGMLYCASDASIYKSSDLGDTWKSAVSGIYADQINFLHSPGENILYAGTDRGLYYSTRGSSDWNKINNFKAYSLKILEDGMIFCGTDMGIYSSIDSGATWKHQYNGPIGTVINEILSLPDDVLIACTDKGLYRTKNQGFSWIKSSQLGDMRIAAIEIVYGDDLFVAAKKGIYKSVDMGMSWTFQTNAFQNFPVQELYVNSHNVFFAMSDIGMYASNDNGHSWDPVSKFGNDFPSFMSEDGQGNVYIGCDKGLYLSEDDGQEWTKINYGLDGLSTNDMKFNSEQDIYAAADEGIYKTTDMGDHWIQLYSGFGTQKMLSVGVLEDEYLFAGSDSEGLFISSDGGANWSEADFEAEQIHDIAVSKVGYVFASSEAGVFRTSDKGVSWIQMFNEFGITTKVTTMYLSEQDTIFIGTDSAGVWRRSVDEHGWTKVEILDFDEKSGVNDVFTMPSGELFVSGRHGVYFSSNNGESWHVRDDGLHGVIVSMSSDSDGILYAGTESKDVWRSDDLGRNWNKMVTVLGKYVVKSLLVDDKGFIYAGTDRDGVWRSVKSQTLEVMNIAITPTENQTVSPTGEIEYIISCSDDDGNKLDQAKVMIFNSLTDTEESFYTDENGEYIYVMTISADAAAGEYQLTFETSKAGFVPARKAVRYYTVEISNVINMSVTPEDPQTVAVGEKADFIILLTDMDGMPIENALLTVDDAIVEDVLEYHSNVEGKIIYSVMIPFGTPSGNYKIEFKGTKYDYADSELMTRVVDVSNAKTLHIAVDELSEGPYDRKEEIIYEIYVRDNLSDPVENAEVQIIGESEDNITTNPSGIATYKYTVPEEAPEGNYKINFRAIKVGFIESDIVGMDYTVFIKSSIDDVSNFNNARISPNPADDIINIKFSIKADAQVEVRIFDLPGREMSHIRSGLFLAGNQELSVSVADLESGIYVIELRSGAETEHIKLIVK